MNMLPHDEFGRRMSMLPHAEDGRRRRTGRKMGREKLGRTDDMQIINRPMDIENRSMQIIGQELADMGIRVPDENRETVYRAIHASADFDYAKNLVFLNDAVKKGIEAVRTGKAIITDTNMALSGIHKKILDRYGNPCVCYMSDEEVSRRAKSLGTTRAEVSMEKASQVFPGGIYAIGNAPTALLKLVDLVESGMRPALVVGVPVGFVNVLESKDKIRAVCETYRIPAIIAQGRKGGSSIAAAILNSIIYKAAGR